MEPCSGGVCGERAVEGIGGCEGACVRKEAEENVSVGIRVCVGIRMCMGVGYMKVNVWERKNLKGYIRVG